MGVVILEEGLHARVNEASGFYRDNERGIAVSNVGERLKRRKARLLHYKRFFQISKIAADKYIMPVFEAADDVPGEFFFPFMGDIFFDGKPIPKKYLEEWGICEATRNGLSVTMPAFQFMGRSLLVPGELSIPGHRLSTGFKVDANGTDSLDGIALQFLGVGGEYIDRLVTEPGPNEEVVKEIKVGREGKPFKVVRDPRLVGKLGIFTDIPYQEYEGLPIGAKHTKERDSLIRDQQLLRYGAIMGGVTIFQSELLNNSCLNSYLHLALGRPNIFTPKISSLGVFLRLILEDTIRLGQLLDEKTYRAFLEERILTRDQHLAELCKTLLWNLNVLFDQAYTLTSDGNLPYNLGPKGALYDSSDFPIIKKDEDIAGGFFSVLLTLDSISRTAGLGNGEIFQRRWLGDAIKPLMLIEDSAQEAIETAREMYVDRKFEECPRQYCEELTLKLYDLYWKARDKTPRSVWDMGNYEVLRMLRQREDIQRGLGVNMVFVETSLQNTWVGSVTRLGSFTDRIPEDRKWDYMRKIVDGYLKLQQGPTMLTHTRSTM